MKKVLLEMEDQKNSYEQKAKESLQKVLEEKMSAEQQLQSTQVWARCVLLGGRDPGVGGREASGQQAAGLQNSLEPRGTLFLLACLNPPPPAVPGSG